ncbi:MAG TPA: outer membrane lipoprotein carrier protein LolA [Candidatus Angelobacter sp.]|nr:outer membrane lipoprotein carrier protein LolA [Candidatus Angelobacter sp.]
MEQQNRQCVNLSSTGRMRVGALLLLAAFLSLAVAQAKAPQGATQNDLESVLAQMNQASATFKSAQTDFEWEQYTKVVDVKDVQKGRLYLRRTSKGVDIGIKIVSPALKEIVVDAKEGLGRMYEPGINQITEYNIGKDKADLEAIMSLGFGGRGGDLRKSYDVKLSGWEMVEGKNTARLELTPTTPKLQHSLSKIVLWIDPARDVALRQQFFEGVSGDYRLVHNSNIVVNGKMPDDAFHLKTSGHPKVLRP